MQFTFDKGWLESHKGGDKNLDIAAGSFFLGQLPTKISDHNSDGPTNLQERQALEDLVKMPD